MEHQSVAVDLTSGTTYRIRVDSPLYSGETNGHVVSFDLSWDLITVPSAPANDNIANIENLGSDPADGEYTRTTKGATKESWEPALTGNNSPSVWFRFHVTANETQVFHVNPAAGSVYWQPYFQLYQITTDPPVDNTDLSFINDGNLSFPAANDATRSIALVGGNDYAIIVFPYFDNGEGSDFSLWFGSNVPPILDSATIYLDLRASGTDVGPYSDEATVYLDLLAGGSEEFHGTMLDDATVSLKITPGAAWETQGRETVDAATVYLDLQVLGGECFSTFVGALLGEGEAELCMATVTDELSMIADAELEWTYGAVTVEGIDC
jgi:hypothetical protein